jgi:hypothetical protein
MGLKGRVGVSSSFALPHIRPPRNDDADGARDHRYVQYSWRASVGLSGASERVSGEMPSFPSGTS